MLTIDDINYNLPQELIAERPVSKRGESRLLIISKNDKTIKDGIFSDIIDYFNAGDCIVFNNTKVFKARLFGITKGIFPERRIELLLVEKINNRRWKAMVKNSKKIPPATEIDFEGIKAVILDRENDLRIMEFNNPMDFEDINKIGRVPLPPYILKKRKSLFLPEYRAEDEEWYQSVLAKHYGSVAAPTASLHFTGELIQKLTDKGINSANITLHVSAGTFKPIDTEKIDEFQIHGENIEVPAETVEILKNTKKNKKRIIAVGTTTVRALETMAGQYESFTDWKEFKGTTRLFIKDTFKFKAIDAIITNFHMPKSTLLLLTFSFGGMELVKKSYSHAVNGKYRFLSYGDAMFIY